VTNTGGAPVTFANISVTSGFVQINVCGTRLAAHGTCWIAVFYDPTSVGPSTGSLTLRDDATNSPQVVNLSVKGGNGR
jgi:hypothetical protein